MNTTETIDLSQLAKPFPMEDIEWRVSRSGIGRSGIFCLVLAYITARAIQERLDEVCGPANWRTEQPQIIDVNGKSAFAVGISIRINNEWLTKWDVSEPTNIEPAKGGFSGGMKRAGAQWGIGRYLYYLDETFAEVTETIIEGSRGWNYAKLSKEKGGGAYYWKAPSLPAWALPREKEHAISSDELSAVKKAWREKFSPESKNPAELRDGFSRFVAGICGEFPTADHACWTRDALERCQKRIAETTEPNGVAGDVPFDS
jgi:hypothetical protein